MVESLSLRWLALLPWDYFSPTVEWPTSLSLSFSFLFIPAKSSPAPAPTWVTPRGGVATSRDGCHRQEVAGCQVIFVLSTRRGFLLNSADRMSCPILPSDRPTGSRQAAGSWCQVSLRVCLLLPGGAPGQAVFLFPSHVAPGSLDVFEGGPHFHRS